MTRGEGEVIERVVALLRRRNCNRSMLIRARLITLRESFPTERALDRGPTRVSQPTYTTSTRTAASCFKRISREAVARSIASARVQ